MDIAESGKQIGEKLFALLDASQQQELMQYVLAQRFRVKFHVIFAFHM